MPEILVAHPERDVCERISIALASAGYGVTATQLSASARRLAVYVDVVLISAMLTGPAGIPGFIADLRAGDSAIEPHSTADIPVVELLEPFAPELHAAIRRTATPAAITGLVTSCLATRDASA